jgi:hypothetical protein
MLLQTWQLWVFSFKESMDWVNWLISMSVLFNKLRESLKAVLFPIPGNEDNWSTTCSRTFEGKFMSKFNHNEWY